MRDRINGESFYGGPDKGCETLASEPSTPRRRPEDFRSEALAQAMELRMGGDDPERVVRNAAVLEGYLVGGFQGAPPMPKRIIHRFADGTLTVEIYRD